VGEVRTEQLYRMYEVAEKCGVDVEDLKFIIKSAGHHKVIGLNCGRNLIGYGLVEFHNSISETLAADNFYNKHLGAEPVAVLAGCAVLPEYRGNNLQKLLIMQREVYAKDQGMPRMVTMVWEDEVASLTNLKALGYELLATRVNRSGETGSLLCK